MRTSTQYGIQSKGSELAKTVESRMCYSSTARLKKAKRLLTVIFKELDIWLDESREDTFVQELFDFSLRAAELSAILGFTRPPIEHVVEVPLETYHALTDTRAQAQVTTIHFNTPEGLGSCPFGFPPPLTEELMSQCSKRIYLDLKSYVRRWLRAVNRIDVSQGKSLAKLQSTVWNSFETTIFEEQHRRELAGIAASFMDDFLEHVEKGHHLAKIHNLSPEQTRLLFQEIGRAAANAIYSPQGDGDETETSGSKTDVRFLDVNPIANDVSQGVESHIEGTRTDDDGVGNSQEIEVECTPVDGGEIATTPGMSSPQRAIVRNKSHKVPTPRNELRAKAEKYVRENGYPGFNKLTRILKCAPASLSNAIKDSNFLKARKAVFEAAKESGGRPVALTDVLLDQTPQQTEASPGESLDTIDDLVADQKADRRADARQTRQRSVR
ncbi:MAG: hypothetical protein AABZ47_15430 [Planctomycetota bacterium]